MFLWGKMSVLDVEKTYVKLRLEFVNRCLAHLCEDQFHDLHILLNGCRTNQRVALCCRPSLNKVLATAAVEEFELSVLFRVFVDVPSTCPC